MGIRVQTAVNENFVMNSQKEVITPLKNTLLLDVSEIYRPEINEENFRKFVMPDKVDLEAKDIVNRVYNLYTQIHTNQTVAFVQSMKEKYLQFNHGKFRIMDALESLSTLIDQSDPDVDVPNIYHGFQTAERIREIHPDEDWFHLAGLIHDLGKVMAVWGEEQYAVVGDTFAVGCAPGDSVVFQDTTFLNNPDMQDERYNTKLGMYSANCGLDQVNVSWGHDEYLYHVLRNHPSCTLPDEALYMIRYHSFYPWHGGGDYWHLANEKDKDYYYWVKEFNKFDLYSKSDDEPNLPVLKEYYQGLIDKYIPGEVAF